MTGLESWKQRARALEVEVAALALAVRHSKTPWPTKLLAGAVIAYALSPIDLIPDFVPVLGYLDDLVLLPLGIALVLRTMPPAVLAECRTRAREGGGLGAGWLGVAGAAVVAVIWLGLLLLAILALVRWLRCPAPG